MKLVEIFGLDSSLAALPACGCMCSGNQYSGSQGAGDNGGICGCYCEGSQATKEANSGRADSATAAD